MKTKYVSFIHPICDQLMALEAEYRKLLRDVEAKLEEVEIYITEFEKEEAEQEPDYSDLIASIDIVSPNKINTLDAHSAYYDLYQEIDKALNH